MDRLTRHDLKSDKFVTEVAHTVEYVEEHRSQLIKYAGIALAVLVIAAGAWYFTKTRREGRMADLKQAFRTYNAVIGESNNPAVKSFPTEEARQKAIVAEITPIATKYSGSEEGAVASYLLGVNAADQGRMDESEKLLKTAIADGGTQYASLAKLALADVYAAQGKPADAEKLLRELVNSPTVLVSKDQATISLARVLSKSKPDEARKLLEPLRSETGAGSRMAVRMLAELPQK